MSETKALCASGVSLPAVKSLSEAIATQPKDPDLVVCLAEAHAALGHISAAIYAYQKAIAINPQNAGAWFRLAAIYSTQNKQKSTIASYRKGLAMQPANLEAKKQYALFLVKAHDFSGSIAPLRALIAAEPENIALHLALIESLLNAGGDITTEIEKFLALASAEQQLDLTRLLIAYRRFDRGQPILAKIQTSTPIPADAYEQMDLLLMGKQDFENAVLQLGQAVQKEPKSSPYTLALAEALLRWHHYATARSFLEAVKASFGTLPEFQYDLAYSYYGLRDLDAAASIVKDVLKQNPKHAPSLFLLGNCYVAQANLVQAEASFQSALQADPKKPAYYAALAEVKRNKGNTPGALILIKKGLALDPGNADLIMESALCHESTGSLALAKIELEG